MNSTQMFYVKLCGRVTGPHTPDEIASMGREGTLSPVHRVSIDQERWQPLHEFDGWRKLWNGEGGSTPNQTEPPAQPPPLPPAIPTKWRDDDDKSEPIDVELL